MFEFSNVNPSRVEGTDLGDGGEGLGISACMKLLVDRLMSWRGHVLGPVLHHAPTALDLGLSAWREVGGSERVGGWVSGRVNE